MTHETTIDYNFLQWRDAKLKSFYNMKEKAEAEYVKASRVVDALFAKRSANDPTFDAEQWRAARLLEISTLKLTELFSLKKPPLANKKQPSALCGLLPFIRGKDEKRFKRSSIQNFIFRTF